MNRMKYIFMELGLEEAPVIFPSMLMHMYVDECIRVYCNHYKSNHLGFSRHEIKTASAGFIYRSLECYGHSESLDLDSRPSEDTDVIRALHGLNKMKYIVMNLDNKEVPICFGSTLPHDYVAEAIRVVRMPEPGGSWSRRYRDAKCISAGFVDINLKCFGRSDSLWIDSRPEIDTELLKNHY